MKTALITGATGFVGGYLADCLSKEFGMEVRGTGLSHRSCQCDAAELFALDILDRGQVSSLLQRLRPDFIFHLAAQSSVGVSWREPSLTVDINIKGSLNVLDAVRALDYKPRVLLVGSGDEYGASGADAGPIDEETVLRPGSVYAATKACQNMLGAIYAKAYGLGVVNVRAFNHIGPGQSAGFVVSDFCRQVAEIEAGLREPVMLVGNLGACRDFTDVRDVVRAYALLSQEGRAGETYNVGSGRAVRISAILEKILSHSTAKIEVRVDESKLRPVDVPKIEADIGRLVRETGWRPRYGIDDTIRDVLDWWRGMVGGH